MSENNTTPAHLAPDETIDDQTRAGAVSVLYGADNGLQAAGNQFWHQNSPGIHEHAEFDDRFGLLLTAGDYDGDGFADLVIGVPNEDVNGLEDCGAVHVIYGAAAGLNKFGNQFWHQDSPGIVDTAAADELFGFALR